MERDEESEQGQDRDRKKDEGGQENRASMSLLPSLLPSFSLICYHHSQ
jgi:hypothetical protein